MERWLAHVGAERMMGIASRRTVRGAQGALEGKVRNGRPSSCTEGRIVPVCLTSMYPSSTHNHSTALLAPACSGWGCCSCTPAAGCDTTPLLREAVDAGVSAGTVLGLSPRRGAGAGTGGARWKAMCLEKGLRFTCAMCRGAVMVVRAGGEGKTEA